MSRGIRSAGDFGKLPESQVTLCLQFYLDICSHGPCSCASRGMLEWIESPLTWQGLHVSAVKIVIPYEYSRSLPKRLLYAASLRINSRQLRQTRAVSIPRTMTWHGPPSCFQGSPHWISIRQAHAAFLSADFVPQEVTVTIDFASKEVLGVVIGLTNAPNEKVLLRAVQGQGADRPIRFYGLAVACTDLVEYFPYFSGRVRINTVAMDSLPLLSLQPYIQMRDGTSHVQLTVRRNSDELAWYSHGELLHSTRVNDATGMIPMNSHMHFAVQFITTGSCFVRVIPHDAAIPMRMSSYSQYCCFACVSPACLATMQCSVCERCYCSQHEGFSSEFLALRCCLCASVPSVPPRDAGCDIGVAASHL